MMQSSDDTVLDLAVVKHLRVGGMRRLMKLYLQFCLNGRASDAD